MIVLAMRCPKCGHWQGRSILNPDRYIFKCDQCGKTRKIMCKKGIGFQVIHQRFLTIKEAIWFATDENGKGVNREGLFETAKSL